MIVEVAIGVCIGGVLASGLRVWRARREPEAVARPEKLPVASLAQAGPRGLLPGDVLLYVGDEMWLESSLTLLEDGHFVGRLLAAPDNNRCAWVLHLDAPAARVALLADTTELPDGTLPSQLPCGGYRYQLIRRATVTMNAQGPITRVASAELAVYKGPAGKLLFSLRGDGLRIDCIGEEFSRDRFEHLPGGDAEP